MLSYRGGRILWYYVLKVVFMEFAWLPSLLALMRTLTHFLLQPDRSLTHLSLSALALISTCSLQNKLESAIGTTYYVGTYP